MPSPTSGLLREVGRGDHDAASRLLPIVYGELRRLAAHYMLAEPPGQTMQPTELVHEAYVRLVGQERISWQGRAHFMAMAATSMRRILVDRARRKSAEKRGAGGEKVSLDDVPVFTPEKSSELLALDEALDQLASLSPRQSRIVEFRYFAGLTFEEIAKLEGLSLRTVKHDWSVARAWLHREIARAT
ncbi:MAG: sigma-70 family RNA polymerase sigma factor [Bryobacteraceae bacterium]